MERSTAAVSVGKDLDPKDENTDSYEGGELTVTIWAGERSDARLRVVA